MKVLEESLILVLSFILIFAWIISGSSELTAPVLGFLIAIYLVLSLRKRGRAFLSLGASPLGVLILNVLVFVLIYSMGSINSPVFFLLFFLCFGIAFVFEPITIFIFVIGTILVFIPDVLKTDLTTNLLKLSSLVLISPLAYFFGLEYRRSEQEEENLESLKERTNEAADSIAKDIESVIKDEKKNLPHQDIEKLNEVLEQTEDLRNESKL